jgi:tRNA G46 methylase TrmB
MVISRAKMTEISPTTPYALGSTDAEHERLIRQAAWLVSHTERLFRDAGMGPGQRVLDIGSGVGDVAILAAKIVGPSGEVVGIERDPRSISRARARVTELGLDNVTFTHSDVSQVPSDKPFDAAVGRYILFFLPDPVQFCVPFLSWFVLEESSRSKNLLGRIFFRCASTCRFGARALH